MQVRLQELHRLRRQCGLTVNGLAVAAQVDPANFRRVCKGLAGASIPTLTRIAQVLNVDVSTLWIADDAEVVAR